RQATGSRSMVDWRTSSTSITRRPAATRPPDSEPTAASGSCGGGDKRCDCLTVGLLAPVGGAMDGLPMLDIRLGHLQGFDAGAIVQSVTAILLQRLLHCRVHDLGHFVAPREKFFRKQGFAAWFAHGEL